MGRGKKGGEGEGGEWGGGRRERVGEGTDGLQHHSSLAVLTRVLPAPVLPVPWARREGDEGKKPTDHPYTASYEQES
jgi:hypothetical protein